LFEEITPSEIQFIAKYIAKKRKLNTGSEDHLRVLLDFFELKRLTTQVSSSIFSILKRDLQHVDEMLEKIIEN
jgi:hypothetical protein